jgi:hypothetical protein
VDVPAARNAGILVWISVVNHGMTTRICSNVSAHHAKLRSVSAAVDTGIRLPIVAFRMKLLESTSRGIIKKKRKGRLA